MNLAPPPGACRPTRRELVGALVAALAAWFLWPDLVALLDSPLGLACGLSVAAFLLRGSLVDAAVLGLAVMLGELAETGLGPMLVAIPAGAAFAITRRPRFSAASSAAVLALLVVAIRFKERFAGTMLTWQDIVFFFLQFRDNVGVMATQPTLLAYSALVLAALAALGVFAWRLDRSSIAMAGRRAQLASALLAMLVAAWGSALLAREVAGLARTDAWTLGSMANNQRPLSAFLAAVGRQPRWLPPARDTAGFARRVHGRLGASPAATVPADIVLFLQESQFNPATIEGCPPQLCALDVFRGSAETVAQGPMRVHVHGGGTWLSEFALNGGVPHTAFGVAGDFAPFNVAPGMRRSFVRSLKAAGYRTVALYPVRGGMMNARSAYAGYGFDRFLDSDDLGLTGSFGTTDEAMHAAARRVLQEERRDRRPVFMMVVTIFNHAEHGTRMDRVPSAMLQEAKASFGDGPLADNVADYVWRTTEFARALAQTRPVVLASGRPAVLAWFGDHQPPFGSVLPLRDRIRPVKSAGVGFPVRNQTWYQVDANVANVAREVSPRALDLAFLPGLLAEAAGVPLDDWLAANVIARADCGGVLQPCERPGARDEYLNYLWKDLREFALP